MGSRGVYTFDVRVVSEVIEYMRVHKYPGTKVGRLDIIKVSILWPGALPKNWS